LYSISIESQPVATAFSRKSISMPLLPPGHITREQRGHPLIGAWTKAFAPQPEEEDDKRLCCRTAILWFIVCC